MEVMFTDVFKYLNFIYIFMCNIITYVIITGIPKDISTGWKRTISTIVAFVAGMLFLFVWHVDKETVICSFFVQYLMYDYVIKWFFKSLEKSEKHLEERADAIQKEETIEEPIEKVVDETDEDLIIM